MNLVAFVLLALIGIGLIVLAFLLPDELAQRRKPW